jgi:hypothetical protein
MAELVGLVASVATIASISKPAIKAARILYDAAEDMAFCAEDLRMFALTMRVFGDSLGLTVHVFRELAPKLLGMVAFIKKNNVLDAIAQSAAIFNSKIEGLLRKIQTLMRRSWLGARIGWLKCMFFDKFDFHLLNSQMQVIKTTFDLLTTSMSLAYMLCSTQTEDLKKEM